MDLVQRGKDEIENARHHGDIWVVDKSVVLRREWWQWYRVIEVFRVCHRYTAGRDFQPRTRFCAASHETRGIKIIKIIITN